MSDLERSPKRTLDTNKLLAWIAAAGGVATVISALADADTVVLIAIGALLALALLALLVRRFVRWVRGLLDEHRALVQRQEEQAKALTEHQEPGGCPVARRT